MGLNKMTRKAQPVHYAAVAGPLLFLLMVGLWFGARKAMWSAIGLILAASAYVTVRCLRLTVRGLRTGFMQTGLGRIERASSPVAFWMVISLSVLIGPLLVGCCLVLTRLW